MRILTLTLSLALGGPLAFAQEVSFSDYTKVNDRYDLFIIGGNESGVFTGIGDDYYYNGLNNKQVISYYDFRQGPQESRVMKPEKKR